MSLDVKVSAKNAIKGNVYTLETIHGFSAYEIAVINGFEGTEAEWLASLKGEDGAPGKDGIDGKDYILTDADKEEIANMAKDSILMVDQTTNKTYKLYVSNGKIMIDESEG